jgi:hypothetical protein
MNLECALGLHDYSLPMLELSGASAAGRTPLLAVFKVLVFELLGCYTFFQCILLRCIAVARLHTCEAARIVKTYHLRQAPYSMNHQGYFGAITHWELFWLIELSQGHVVRKVQY